MSTDQQATDHYPRFPHLENLDRVPFVLEADHLVVTEKVHGFNARFGVTLTGTFWVGSRNNTVFTAKTVDGEGDTITGDPDGLQGFTRFATRHRWAVPPGYTFYGEWAGRGIQKGISYGTPDFFLFAIRDTYGWHPRWALTAWAERLNINTVPILYEGPNPGMAMLDELRKGRSLLALENREGIVIWPTPMAFDRYGNPAIAKFKAPGFAETAHARKDRPAPADLGNVVDFVEEYATDERLSHVLEQVEDDIRHNLQDATGNPDPMVDPLDRMWTGRVLRAYYEDVVREGQDHYAQLSENDQKAVGKVLNGYVKALMDARRAASIAA